MMHHIICDRLSVGVLWRELGTLYEAFLHGQPSPLPSLPHPIWRLRDLAATTQPASAF